MHTRCIMNYLYIRTYTLTEGTNVQKYIRSAIAPSLVFQVYKRVWFSENEHDAKIRLSTMFDPSEYERRYRKCSAYDGWSFCGMECRMDNVPSELWLCCRLYTGQSNYHYRILLDMEETCNIWVIIGIWFLWMCELYRLVHKKSKQEQTDIVLLGFWTRHLLITHMMYNLFIIVKIKTLHKYDGWENATKTYSRSCTHVVITLAFDVFGWSMFTHLLCIRLCKISQLFNIHGCKLFGLCVADKWMYINYT